LNQNTRHRTKTVQKKGKPTPNPIHTSRHSRKLSRKWRNDSPNEEIYGPRWRLCEPSVETREKISNALSTAKDTTKNASENCFVKAPHHGMPAAKNTAATHSGPILSERQPARGEAGERKVVIKLHSDARWIPTYQGWDNRGDEHQPHLCGVEPPYLLCVQGYGDVCSQESSSVLEFPLVSSIPS
jgi:hypothetical protein